MTARPHCLIPLYFFRSARPSLSFYIPHSTVLSFLFSKKRQWQDLNLRIQRIIDFKSIALDHSATLSIHSFLSSASPFLSLSLLSIPFLYLLFFFLSYPTFFPDLLPTLPFFPFISVISNSIVGSVSSPVT